MAAYAAVASLMNVMENIHIHPRISTSLDRKQTESLGEKIGFFLDFMENHNSHGGMSKEEVEDLQSQIASAAHVAEDVIETYIVDHIHAGFTETSPSFLTDLQKIIEDMDSIKENVTKVKEMRLKDQPPTCSKPAASSSRPPTTGKTTMVGFDGYLTQLLERLTEPQSMRQIIPITGMGGIGKTTLARNIYENSLVVEHFDIRAWVTISQEYNVREILVEALSCLGKSTSNTDTEDKLGGQLRKILFGRRYLIILDDIWSIEAWNKINFFFPENGNGSRIMVTTRQSDVASDFGSLGLALNFLDADESWDLFCEKAFGREGCPPKLERIGRNIVKKCNGLPLSIVVIGRLLRKSSSTQEYWANVAKDISSTLNSAEENQCFNILSLSYSYLPACLKPCFLYLGIFPEDHDIHVSRLIKLWVAEGFLKPNTEQSLEEVAEGYIKDLVDRNLVLVRRLSWNRKFKTCSIHDLLRDLCIKVAEKEKFFCVVREIDTPRDVYRERRIVIHKRISENYQIRQFHTLESTSLARSIFTGFSCDFLWKCRLLRVMPAARSNSLDINFQQQVNLRNLRVLDYDSIGKNDGIGSFKVPSSMSLLWNLQTLIIRGRGVANAVAPSEIWEMPQLRHLNFENYVRVPDPPLSGEQDDIVLRNLQTLQIVLNFKCSEEVCKRMPNIKKLQMVFGDYFDEGHTMSYYCLYNMAGLNKLESISLYCIYKKVPNHDDLLQNLKFPSSLKKLYLGGWDFRWDDLTMIGSLPHLEILRMYETVTGSEWNPVEGEFLRLKSLEIYWSDELIRWNAESSHFPVLENLVLEGLSTLDEIPLGIGDIPTLERASVVECSVSAAISAIKILKDQEGLENYGLHVRIHYWRSGSKTKQEEAREKVELEGYTGRNLQLIFDVSY